MLVQALLYGATYPNCLEKWKTIMRNLKTLSLIGLLSMATACNSYVAKDSGGPLVVGGESPDFSTIQTNILQPKCVACHSTAGGNAGGINVENYANVIHSIDQIQDSLTVKQTMPPGQPLPGGLQTLFTTWVRNGAPEHTAGGGESPGPQPNPSPTPSEDLQSTFSSISKNILEPKCVMCHGPGGSAEKLPVKDYGFLIKYEWIVPNDTTQSLLYESVKQGRMPPSGPLSQKEIDTIAAWINDGAANN
jgi:uncharacterized membrane protein